MCFAINVYPINIDFVFVAKFDRQVDIFTLLLMTYICLLFYTWNYY